jgi:uracil-DNA glycosylase
MISRENIAAQTAASLIEWWKAAGADFFTSDEPYIWVGSNDNAESIQTGDVLHAESLVSASAVTLKPALWPKSLPELLSEFSENCGFPGTSYGGNIARPAGNTSATLMIISDLPDVHDAEAGLLGSGAYGSLLREMIAATGGDLSDCYFTSLASTRPASGDIPEHDLSELVKFVRHQIWLLKPEMLLILGTVACQALLNSDFMVSRRNLHYLNHDGKKVASVVTFHPRTLLARPILKAQSWKDLQMLDVKGAL